MANAEAPETEAEILRRGLDILTERLPAGWTSRQELESVDTRIDALVEVSAADGRSTTLVVEAKRIVEGRDVGRLSDRLEQMAQGLPNAQGLVVARYLSRPVREKLAAAGLSYVDATGNVRVETAAPGLFISDRGADSDPWRGPGRPRGTLKGEPAAKIVRVLADFSGPWPIRDLVEVARTSTGAAYRVIEYLEREGLANRDDAGRVVVPDWSEILRRWSDDYGFVRDNAITRWIAPRGLPDLTKRMADAEQSIRYAMSGTLAAAEWAAYAPARLAMIYVSNANEAAAAWDLRPTDSGANVMLAEPQYDVVFQRRLTNESGVVIAAPTQVVVDLMTGPGRNPSEAEELLQWMKRNEQSWRS